MAEPLPLCYLNGTYLPLADARISPLDRGFLYADSVYEVMPVYRGRPFRFTAHSERLSRSLAGISMEDPHTREEWRSIRVPSIARHSSRVWGSSMLMPARLRDSRSVWAAKRNGRPPYTGITS